MSTNYLKDLPVYIQSVRPQFEDCLARMVAVPTVSADPSRASDMQRGAQMAVQLLHDSGFSAKVASTDGLPVVFAELIPNPAYPTLTIYNHLDVQPASRDQWRTDPFKLTKAGDRYVGRGATDDKGPALTALMAMRYAHTQMLPLNFKVIWEFEEEVGSTHFEDFVRRERAALATDSVLISDTVWISSSKPAIPTGLRGLMAFEISVQTGGQEVHSGLAGGAARNPLGEIAQIIAECYDAATGQVKVPGFYSPVIRPTEQELDGIVAAGFTVDRFMASHELSSLRAADAREVIARIMTEPTFEVHGITGGYTGPGIKTTIPYAATAKLSTRLVPDQEPEAVFGLIKDFIEERHPDARVTYKAGLDAYRSDTRGPYAEAARTAVSFAFGVEPAFVREGGSIGAVLTMSRYLEVPIIFLGLSLPEHGYHAPNEYYDWGQASGGMAMFVRYFEEVAHLGKRSA